jgi:hypothetical protein
MGTGQKPESNIFFNESELKIKILLTGHKTK